MSTGCEIEKGRPSSVNVRDQERDPNSMLVWMERLIRARREMHEIAFGDWSLLPIADPAVLAIRYQWGHRQSIIFHNLSSSTKEVSFPLNVAGGKPAFVDCFGDTFSDIAISRDGTATLELAGSGSGGSNRLLVPCRMRPCRQLAAFSTCLFHPRRLPQHRAVGDHRYPDR